MVYVILILLVVCIVVLLFIYINNTRGTRVFDIFTGIALKLKKTVPDDSYDSSAEHKVIMPHETIYFYQRNSTVVICPGCDVENPYGMPFCQVCGARLR